MFNLELLNINMIELRLLFFDVLDSINKLMIKPFIKP